MITTKKLSDLDTKLKLLAVTKNRSLEEIQEMLQRTGIKQIGENRLKEAQEKLHHLPKEIEKHFIGKLQSRKIPQITQLFDVIQSVENLKQAKQISNQNKEIKIFLQINISRLPQRSGAKPEEAKDLIAKIQKLPNLKLIGIMGMASQDPKLAKSEFALLKSLQNGLSECSMGMSSDYQIAIQEGSTMIRIGTALFDQTLEL